MRNPITTSRKALTKFISLWILIIVAHGIILSFHYRLPLQQAFTDSIIFNGLFALFGINLWYLVKYSESDAKNNFFKIGLTFFLAGFVIISIWFTAGVFIANKLINSPHYSEFLANSKIWRLTAGTLFFIIFALVYYVIIYKNNWEEKLQQEKLLQESIRKIELDALKMQINPHFLFNALNSISSLTVTNPETAQDMIIKMSEYLRYSLKHNNNRLATLKEEISNVMRYLEIEQMRFQDKLTYEINCDLPTSDIHIPALILQPLFENAIKHGVYNSSEPVNISLNCIEQKDSVNIIITNNFDPETKTKKGEGVGLQNVADRLRYTYNKHRLLQIKQTENTFTVIMKIPYNH